MAEAGRSEATEEYGVKRVIESYEALYARVVERVSREGRRHSAAG